MAPGAGTFFLSKLADLLQLVRSSDKLDMCKKDVCMATRTLMSAYCGELLLQQKQSRQHEEPYTRSNRYPHHSQYVLLGLLVTPTPGVRIAPTGIVASLECQKIFIGFLQLS